MHPLLNKLYASTKNGAVKYGLANSLKLSALWGKPELCFSCIHIAGSNGKGSVATKIAKGLQLSGLKVGLYTSPHISCFRERITINGVKISESALFELLKEAFKLIEEHNIPATFFEITTLLAFRYFANQHSDIVVVETGLGGRLDATNIVRPKLAILTSISLEHTELLGYTLEDIAKEKAGIIKPHVPVIIGPRVPKDIVKEVAAKLNSPFERVTGNFEDFDCENRAIAAKAMEQLGLSGAIIKEAIKALPPCRLEVISLEGNPKVILDVAHNPDGFNHLFKALKKRFPKVKLHVVCGLSSNKDTRGCLAILKKYAVSFHFVQAPSERSCSAKELADLLMHQGVSKEKIYLEPTIAKSLQMALDRAENEDLVVVCGTFFIMSQVRQALNICEERDPIDFNEKRLPLK